jgi:hypothetical protein
MMPAARRETDGGPTMKRSTLVALFAAAAVLCASAADAAPEKKKKPKVQRGHAPVVVSVPAAPRIDVDPTMGRTRPAWAGPNECFTDEGYGRFVPCSISRDNF